MADDTPPVTAMKMEEFVKPGEEGVTGAAAGAGEDAGGEDVPLRETGSGVAEPTVPTVVSGAAGEEPLLEGWKEYLDLSTDRPMWYSAATRATTWFRPTASHPPQLRGEWMQMWDPATVQVYYFNIVTRQSQWHLPSAFLDAREEEVKQASWMKLVDDAGRPYYYSTLSRRVQWTMPEGFEERPAPTFPPKLRADGEKRLTKAVPVAGSSASMTVVAASGAGVLTTTVQPSRRFTGHLLKQGGGSSMFGKKNWKERFVVMHRGRLAYFRSEQSCKAGDPPLKNTYLVLGNYDLDVKADSAVQFTLVPNARAKAAYDADPKSYPNPTRSYEFQVTDPAKKTAWLSAIRCAIDEKVV